MLALIFRQSPQLSIYKWAYGQVIAITVNRESVRRSLNHYLSLQQTAILLDTIFPLAHFLKLHHICDHNAQNWDYVHLLGLMQA